MTTPFVDPTLQSPEAWGRYRQRAIAALHSNPHDAEALQAVRDANNALSVYDQAEAASPGERVRSGVSAGLTGLGQAVADIPHGLAQTVAHPINTLLNLPRVPGALLSGLTSNDPEQVARTVGNVGSLLLPFAKANPAGTGILMGSAEWGGLPRMARPLPTGPTVAQVAGGAAQRVAGAVIAPVRNAMELPGLTARLKRLDIAQREAQLAQGPPVAPAVDPAIAAARDLRLQILGEQLAKLRASGATVAQQRPLRQAILEETAQQAPMRTELLRRRVEGRGGAGGNEPSVPEETQPTSPLATEEARIRDLLTRHKWGTASQIDAQIERMRSIPGSSLYEGPDPLAGMASPEELDAAMRAGRDALALPQPPVPEGPLDVPGFIRPSGNPLLLTPEEGAAATTNPPPGPRGPSGYGRNPPGFNTPRAKAEAAVRAGASDWLANPPTDQSAASLRGFFANLPRRTRLSALRILMADHTPNGTHPGWMSIIQELQGLP